MTRNNPSVGLKTGRKTWRRNIRAAEYVLGTLGTAEREEAQAMLAFDPVFAALVRDWERRLGELHALADSLEPPAAVWDAIKAKLPEIAQSAPI